MEDLAYNTGKGKRIAFSFIAFFLIGCLHSCQEMKIREEQKAGQIIDMNVPKITYSDILQEKDPIEDVLKKYGLLEEETEVEEELDFAK